MVITENSRDRKKKLLNERTNISSKKQICKGMAEVYAGILNAIGIKSKVVGANMKGEIDGTNIR